MRIIPKCDGRPIVFCSRAYIFYIYIAVRACVCVSIFADYRRSVNGRRCSGGGRRANYAPALPLSLFICGKKCNFRGCPLIWVKSVIPVARGFRAEGSVEKRFPFRRCGVNARFFHSPFFAWLHDRVCLRASVGIWLLPL